MDEERVHANDSVRRAAVVDLYLRCVAAKPVEVTVALAWRREAEWSSDLRVATSMTFASSVQLPSRRPVRALLVAALATIAAATGGCEVNVSTGDSGDDAEPKAPVAAGSRTFAERADAICTEHASRVRAIGNRLGIPKQPDQYAAYDRERTTAAANQLDALERLVPPADQKQAYAGWLENHRAYVRTFEQGVAAAQARDEQAYKRHSQERFALGSKQLAVAKEFGMQACSRTLPSDAEAEVRELVTRVLTGQDPKQSCQSEVTRAFIESNAGGSISECEVVLSELARDGATVTFTGFSGVDEVLASAKVRFSTRQGKAPKALTYDLIYEEGRVPGWRLDSAFDPQTVQPSSPAAGASGSAVTS